MYFQPPYTKENIKKQYRELSKDLHPDGGGDNDKFILMKYEYDVLINIINKEKEVPAIRQRVIIKKKKPKPVHFKFSIDPKVLKILKKIFK